MTNYFNKSFELRYFEMNKFGEASPTTILTLLEETAAEHCYDIDNSLYFLEKQNIGWVIISGNIDMVRYPKYKEKILIRTWLSRYSLVKCYRENIIFDGSGNIIGRAKGIWAFYDIEKKKPVPIFEEIKNKWGTNPDISCEINLDLIKIIDSKIPQIEFDVHKSDVDSNKHVNNIRYYHWLIESLPDEILDNYYLKRVNARFHNEANLGEKIQVFIKNEMEQNVFLVTMKSNITNKLLVTAHTVWEKK